MANAQEISEAFNTHCPKRNWTARTITVQRGGNMTEHVSFKDRQGLISLMYDCERGEHKRFSVVFEKATAAWGDYNNAISKGLHTVLAALQAGGLPFKAPTALDSIVIRTQHAGVGGSVTVEYEEQPGSDIF